MSRVFECLNKQPRMRIWLLGFLSVAFLVAIPVWEIDRLGERTVYLKLGRKGVEALPSVQVRRKRL
jgi:hypothetical protein